MSYTIEEFDGVKTKVLKYIMYKKRTEKEVRQKFSSSVDENLLDEVIENLKERFDASINSQMDVIIRNILKNTGNGQLDSLEQYAEEKNEDET